jgi:hypothetical protein
VSINGASSLYFLFNWWIRTFFRRTKICYPFWICKDVTVLTNNFSAEYGLTGSGIINTPFWI